MFQRMIGDFKDSIGSGLRLTSLAAAAARLDHNFGQEQIILLPVPANSGGRGA